MGRGFMKNELLEFLDESPTSWHAVESIKTKLKKAGYQELKEDENWHIAFQGKYFVTRKEASIIAFKTPSEAPKEARILTSHLDSPTFKLKSNPEFIKENMLMLGLEVYGSPLITSWFNRDLKISGKVFYLNQKNQKESSLIDLEEFSVIIPQLAIHLDREANEMGPKFNKQDQLAAIMTLDEKIPFLKPFLQKKLKAKEILSFDLLVVPKEKAKLIGFKEDFISSYRIDSLLSVYAGLKGLLNAKKNSKHKLDLIAFFDHEEVGSDSHLGANSPFLGETLERILISMHFKREDYFKLLSKSLLLSVDLAHTTHPTHMNKHEPEHKILFNHGVVIKQNAKLAYASTASSISTLIELCHLHEIPYQHFVSRNDIPSGSTVGPINATRLGIESIDIGISQLSMHSARELASLKDQKLIEKLLTHYFS